MVMPKRILAIDWGEKRLGIAVTDPLNVIAQPLAVLHPKKTKPVWSELRDLIKQYDVQTVVVGIPHRTDGKPGETVELVRHWIKEAQRELPKSHIVEIDERFTTKEAGRLLHERGITSKAQKGKLDPIAAALILELFLQSQKTKS